MEKIIRFCERVSQGSGILAGVMMLIGLSLVLIEIVIRTLFDKTLYITEEYTGYLMVAITFMGLAYTLKEKGHIRMVFLHKILKGKARIILDIYSFTIGFIFFAIVTFTTTNFFWDSVVSQSRSMQISETYLAIPQFFMPLGSFIITLQFAAELIRAIIQLRMGTVKEQEIESKALGH
ncbi:MAG: TRAP-type transport system small permease protein [Clostridia bacterium]|jgi:TRAP-type C4-dicarboxylate transport system permease small subunit|nr:TRAP-type transport system small permease protein [Clostridia bacterium]MDN5322509.1 TRAP-type transport system small permease protein [Clostridia bacterium]